MKPRHRSTPIALLAALAAMATTAIAEPHAPRAEPVAPAAQPLGGRWLHATARHLHGDLGPLPPNSPGGAGVYRVGGARVMEASASHPFSVGHFGPWGCGLPTPLWLHVSPRHALGGPFLGLPLQMGCRSWRGPEGGP